MTSDSGVLLKFCQVFYPKKIVVQPDIDQAQDQIVFCGDSPNDSPMFSFFKNSVGVANVLDYAKAMEQQPYWMTKKRTASGFVELAEALQAAHSDT